MEFPKWFCIRSLCALAQFTCLTELTSILAHEWPPVPSSDIFICSLVPKLSKCCVCLVKYLSYCISIMGNTYDLVKVVVGSPNKIILDGEVWVLIGFVEDKCE
jgi:hypothetical protein